jgi:hypothetical protein
VIDKLQDALQLARSLPAESLPGFLGEIEQIRVTALARISAPAIPQATPDALLGVNEAAGRLGVSPSYLYRNHSRFGFTRRMGRSLLFSTQGIQTYIRVKR